jgi:hypothetical protein
VIARLRQDAEYREESLKAAVECLKDGEVNVARSMLHDHICATLGFEKLASLTGKSPESLRDMLHPDCDTSADELFEIIGHIRKHEGVRLEVKAHSEETAVTQSA